MGAQEESTAPGAAAFGDEPVVQERAPRALHPTKRGPVTVLFVDLCGYTSMSEVLDPEDLRDIMTQIFGGVARIASKYAGHIDKLLGDAALVLFGVPSAHEDDAIRAINAAREIHEFVAEQSPRLELKARQELCMHSALSTGVVLTSEVDHSAADSALGDTVNLASRLLALAKPGEIVCSSQTQAQAQGYFDFESMGDHVLRGREGTVEVFRVGRPRELPSTAHRVWGVRAELIGRHDEWRQLREAVHLLQHGEAALISIYGGAGTGKSRLVEEFRDSVEARDTHWLESSSRPYSQNIPYDPFVESISRWWGVRDGDPPEAVRQKVAENVARYPDTYGDAEACVDALFGLEHAQLEGLDSESWKSHLFEFVRSMLVSEARRVPTVIYVGDLHWADPSSLDLLRFVIDRFDAPALFIATYRPPFSLFEGPAAANVRYQEIGLRDLSRSESADMLASLLDTDEVPAPLCDFLQNQAEGNPFYLEELVNSLIDTGALLSDGQSWSIARPLDGSDLPLTVVGVVAARLDRLDPSARRVLQEASVIGRRFTADLLGRITSEPDCDARLNDLQMLDLIRVRALEPRTEYEFKHAVIQEVAYEGLLRSDRRELHEKVGETLEDLAGDRRAEFYETFALHFSRGISTLKAVDYLVKSAERSFRRQYAVEESYQFYKQAFEALEGMPQSPERDRLLVNVLNGWAYVIYDRGCMAELEDLLDSRRGLAESLGESPEYAQWCVCLAIALHCRERFREALEYAREALRMAEALQDDYIAACARVWVAYALSEIGKPDEAIVFAERSIPVLESDAIYITEAYSALAYAHWTKGDASATFAVGQKLLEMGRTGPSTRAEAAGHWVMGEGHLADGDFVSAARCFTDSITTSPEPWPSYHPRVFLAIAYMQMGRYEDAEPYLRKVFEISRERGAEITLTPALALLGVVTFARGEMTRGMKMLDEAGAVWNERHAVMRIATLESILGQVYLNIVSSDSQVSLGLVARNIGFLARTGLNAATLSEAHFNEAIRICTETGAIGSRGEAYLGLSRLYASWRKKEKARQCADEAVKCFESAGIETYLRQAQELLASLT